MFKEPERKIIGEFSYENIEIHTGAFWKKCMANAYPDTRMETQNV